MKQTGPGRLELALAHRLHAVAVALKSIVIDAIGNGFCSERQPLLFERGHLPDHLDRRRSKSKTSKSMSSQHDIKSPIRAQNVLAAAERPSKRRYRYQITD